MTSQMYSVKMAPLNIKNVINAVSVHSNDKHCLTPNGQQVFSVYMYKYIEMTSFSILPHPRSLVLLDGCKKNHIFAAHVNLFVIFH